MEKGGRRLSVRNHRRCHLTDRPDFSSLLQLRACLASLWVEDMSPLLDFGINHKSFFAPGNVGRHDSVSLLSRGLKRCPTFLPALLFLCRCYEKTCPIWSQEEEERHVEQGCPQLTHSPPRRSTAVQLRPASPLNPGQPTGVCFEAVEFRGGLLHSNSWLIQVL